MQQFRIIYDDPWLVAIHKPAGYFVHQPEDARHRTTTRLVCLNSLRDQIGQKLFPVHRLDRPAQGVLLFAKDSQTASDLCGKFARAEITKRYWVIARGHLPDEGQIDYLDAQTQYRTLSKIEIPHAVGRYPSARYSWLEVRPITGRYHQIRRHLRHLSHPVIGDKAHGDSDHNLFFAETLNITGLLLRSVSLEFSHPQYKKTIQIDSLSAKNWGKIQDLFGFRP